jgi:hypothetical protein
MPLGGYLRASSAEESTEKVTAGEGWELGAVEARERLGPEGLEVGDRVAHQLIDGGVGSAGDGQLLGGHVDEVPGTAGGRGGRRAGARRQEHDAHGQRATEVPCHRLPIHGLRGRTVPTSIGSAR